MGPMWGNGITEECDVAVQMIQMGIKGHFSRLSAQKILAISLVEDKSFSTHPSH
jgi:hypothetical protein